MTGAVVSDGRLRDGEQSFDLGSNSRMCTNDWRKLR